MAVRKKYDRNVLGRGLDNISTSKGRGLDALIDTTDIETQGSSNLNEISLNLIDPNPNPDIKSSLANDVGEPHRWQD